MKSSSVYVEHRRFVLKALRLPYALQDCGAASGSAENYSPLADKGDLKSRQAVVMHQVWTMT